MHNEDVHTQSIGKIHEVLLDNPVRTGIGAASVTEEDNRVGIRILHLQPCFPYLFDVVAHELGSVVAGAYRHVARVLGDIIDTVRDYLRLGEGLEVMVERLGLPHTKRLPLTLEVADKFLLLGVDTQNGKPELGAFLPDLGDVSVGGGHPASYLRDGQRHPEDILVLRETGKVRLYDETERVHPFGMERQPGLAPAPGTADATLSRSVPGTEFHDALADRIFTMSHFFTNFADAMSANVERTFRKVVPQLAFIELGHKRPAFGRKALWRRFLGHLKGVVITFKVKKISPDFLYYFINNQQIKSNSRHFFKPSCKVVFRDDFHLISSSDFVLASA